MDFMKNWPETMQVLVAVLVGLCIQQVRPLILDDECFAPEPCGCSWNQVRCNGFELNDMPVFLPVDDVTSPMTSLDISLYANSFTSIGSNVFHGVASVITPSDANVTINLRYNDISTIDDDAFAGIDYAIKELDLRANNLSTIPAALGRLTALKLLYLGDNPIRTMTSPAMTSLTQTVVSFSISMDLFSQWPEELDTFQSLAMLDIEGYPLSDLPPNALSGLQTSLTHLSLSKTKLTRIPAAICDLHELQVLHYNQNAETLTPILEPCSDAMTSVRYLNIESNGLVTFPDIFPSFPALYLLNAAHNNIRTFDAGVVPSDHPLSVLILGRNQLARIPKAVSRLTRLTSLAMFSNKIDEVGSSDLEGLSSLSTLDLSSNPIESVADKAFDSLVSMNDIDMKNTKMKAIPRAVTSFTHLTSLVFTGDLVDCTCEMSYLNGWYSNQIHIVGMCLQSHENLSAYLQNALPLCK